MVDELLRSRDSQLARRIRRILNAFEARRDEVVRESVGREERSRLGQNLHDSLAQSVCCLGLLADASARLLQQGKIEAAHRKQREISDQVRELLAELRIQIFDLLPSQLDDEGLAGAIRARLAAVEKRAGVRTSFSVVGKSSAARDVETELLAVVRELLNNSLRHAAAGHVGVVLRLLRDRVEIEVSDDGIGFDPARGKADGGLGLRGIEDRVRRLGASFRLVSEPGRGTRALLIAPLEVPRSGLAS